MAERAGFEPAIELPLYTLSKVLIKPLTLLLLNKNYNALLLIIKFLICLKEFR